MIVPPPARRSAGTAAQVPNTTWSMFTPTSWRYFATALAHGVHHGHVVRAGAAPGRPRPAPPAGVRAGAPPVRGDDPHWRAGRAQPPAPRGAVPGPPAGDQRASTLEIHPATPFRDCS